MNNESVGKKIVEALKKQAESMDIEETFFSFGFEKRYTPEDKIYIMNEIINMIM